MAGIPRGGNSTTAPQGSGNSGRDGSGPGLLGMRMAGAGAGTTPTVMYLMILVVIEVLAYAGIRYVFRGVHGG